MPHQTRLMSVRCRVPRQMDLFAGEPQKTIGDTPAWSGLPTEIRAALTDLMTRLILEHADSNRNGAEARHPLIAVGTPVTERPPHRSVRAELPHTAPTSGS